MAFVDPDLCRSVIQCVCERAVAWHGPEAARLQGWRGRWVEEENGRVRRVWTCPECAPPLPVLAVPAVASAPLPLGPFDGRRVHLVRISGGTKLAIEERALDDGSIRAWTWRASSRRWTRVLVIAPDRILGAAAPRDRRVVEAARAWPPPPPPR